ncbi:MAG: ureidoglycolate lyase [Clostridia bacterium]|nr:ureidoglycolate lyase [Clostridia bacterium]
MRVIKPQPLSKKAFAPYGEYYSMQKPDGYALQGEIHRFFPDRVLANMTNGNVGFSTILVKKPEQMLIKQAEYHTTTCELIMPLNDDMIIHVAQPSAGKPIPEETRAFIVPKHTLVKMNACIWHLAPLPKTKDELAALIVLPECTYINDCKVVDLQPEEQFVIEL